MQKMVDNLKAKIIDVILFCYIMEGEIEMNSFTCIVFILFSYILHSMAIFRAEYVSFLLPSAHPHPCLAESQSKLSSHRPTSPFAIL
jgi:hypothetical protein